MGDGDNLEEEMDDIDFETAAVIKQQVETSTRDGYERRNINFMICFFDNLKIYPNPLEPTIDSQMEATRSKDSQRRTKNVRPCKSRESIRATRRKVLRAINSGVVNTIPIKLEKLNFKDYARFLSTFKKTVKKRNIVGTIVVSNSSFKIRLRPSSYDASFSALSHPYLECGIYKEKTSKELWTQLLSYKKGTRRLAIKESKQLGLAAIEGKNPLPFRAYK